jgi:hypothetical protein
VIRADVERIVWATVARESMILDEDPETVIERTLLSARHGRYPGGIEAFAAECSIPWPTNGDILDAAAWAGRARWALQQRDRAVREAVFSGASKRSVAAAVGLTPPAVDRIIGREHSNNARW